MKGEQHAAYSGTVQTHLTHPRSSPAASGGAACARRLALERPRVMYGLAVIEAKQRRSPTRAKWSR